MDFPAQVVGCFDLRMDLPSFKTLPARTSLVQLKEFSAENNQDLYSEEQQQQQQMAAAAAEAQRLAVPGLVNPNDRPMDDDEDTLGGGRDKMTHTQTSGLSSSPGRLSAARTPRSSSARRRTKRPRPSATRRAAGLSGVEADGTRKRRGNMNNFTRLARIGYGALRCRFGKSLGGGGAQSGGCHSTHTAGAAVAWSGSPLLDGGDAGLEASCTWSSSWACSAARQSDAVGIVGQVGADVGQHEEEGWRRAASEPTARPLILVLEPRTKAPRCLGQRLCQKVGQSAFSPVMTSGSVTRRRELDLGSLDLTSLSLNHLRLGHTRVQRQISPEAFLLAARGAASAGPQAGCARSYIAAGRHCERLHPHKAEATRCSYAANHAVLLCSSRVISHGLSHAHWLRQRWQVCCSCMAHALRTPHPLLSSAAAHATTELASRT